MLATNKNTASMYDLQAQIEANKIQFARLETDVAGLLAGTSSESKYIGLNGETAAISFAGGADDIFGCHQALEYKH